MTGIVTGKVSGEPVRQAGSVQRQTYWLLTKIGDGRIEPLIVNRLGANHLGAKTLPVFSFRDEAEMFSLLEGLNGGWQTRETSAGELLSLLAGLCAGVKLVALDPLPEMVANGTSGMTLGLVSVSRERFTERVASRRILRST